MDSPHHHLLQHREPTHAAHHRALGHQLPSCDITISALNLVIQHGPERNWHWSVTGTVRLDGNTADHATPNRQR
jgi:hypothetical protein